MIIYNKKLQTMKRLLLFALYLFYIAPCFAQEDHNIILVGTSSVVPGNFVGIFDGFSRMDVLKKSYHKDSPFIFWIGDYNAGYDFILRHYNYCNKNRPDLLVSDVKISDLTTDTFPNAEIINIDEYFVNKTKEEVWRWMLYHYKNRTKVWVADYSSAYKSSDSLPEPDMIKVVQVRIFVWTIPESFRNKYYAGIDND